MSRPSQRRYTLLAVALDRLRELVAQQCAQGVPRLPTVRELAQHCRASPVTVCRALAVLKREGILLASPRRGIHIAAAARDGTAQGHSSPVGLTPLAAVRACVERDIFTGRLQDSSGVLPSVKELCAAYGVSAGLMRQVLEAMAGEEEISRVHKRYRVLLQAPAMFGSSVVLFGRGGRSGTLELVTERHHELVSAFERSCYSRRTMPRTVGISVSERLSPMLTGGRKGNEGAGPAGEPVLGYVIVRAGLAQSRELLVMLAQTGRPVVVIDEDDAVRAPAYAVGLRNVRVMDVGASPEQAFTVGKRLLSLGHRSAAYVNPFAGARWSENRRLGLVRSFEGSGCGSRVTAVTADLGQFWSQFTSALIGPDLYGVLDSEQLAGAVAAAHPGFTRPVNRWVRAAPRIAGLRTAADSLYELFVRALGTGATAWVVCSDSIAFLALDFLSRKRIAVPRQVSVVGFDDTFGALRHGLASYSFDLPGVAHTAVSLVLRPQTGRSVHSSDPVQVAGMLVERATLGAAPLGSAAIPP